MAPGISSRDALGAAAYPPRMPKSVRAAAFALLLLAVAALAYAPLFGSQYAPIDVPYLVRASAASGKGASDAARVLAGADGPLARLSLRVSSVLWTSGGLWTPAAARWIRVENALLLLGAAAVGRLVVRRALAPWTGRDGARASAGAFALLFACHPACVASVARAGGRGDLLALFLGALAAWLFLHGRQDRRPRATTAAGILVVLAGHASAIALLCPPLLAVLELFCTRRQRPLAVRLRTSATTLLVFGACAGLETLTGPALGSAPLAPRALASVHEVFRLEGLARGLGALALPVAASAGGSAAARASLQVLAGALLLAALQPALVAARSAPRLWGWLAATASGAFALALLVGLASAATTSGASPVPAEEAALLPDLLPGAVVAACVLAIASSALSGARRVVIPGALAAGFTLLAQIAAGPWERAGRTLADLERDLAEARSDQGGSAVYLVVDPPGTWTEPGPDHRPPQGPGHRLEQALAPGEPALALLLDPSVCPKAAPGDTAIVRGIAMQALHAFALEPEFEAMRRSKLVLLRALPTEGSPRVATAVPAPAPSGPVGWRPGELRSERLDVDPFEKHGLRALALPNAATGAAPRMGWRSGDSETFSATGLWISGAEGPIAYFDLSRRDDWLFGARPQRIWLEPPLEPVRPPELLADAPAIAPRSAGGPLEPSVRDGQWTFEVDSAALPRPLRGDARFVLTLIEPESLRYLQREPRSTAGAGALVFDVPEDASAERQAWSLELLCGDACIARARGRR